MDALLAWIRASATQAAKRNTCSRSGALRGNHSKSLTAMVTGNLHNMGCSFIHECDTRKR